MVLCGARCTMTSNECQHPSMPLIPTDYKVPDNHRAMARYATEQAEKEKTKKLLQQPQYQQLGQHSPTPDIPSEKECCTIL